MADSSENIYSRYNYDDILVRSIIAGLLDLLNNKIIYGQIWADNIEESVRVPWMYNFATNGERFKQDNYDFFGYSCFGKKIEGNFDMFPRGTITYNSANIESGDITNRFVLGTYMKNEGGKLRSYTSCIYSIPLNISFGCEIWYDNVLTGLKIEQAIREYFYKNKSFYVLFKGMQINCCAGFPETYNNEKTTEFSFGTDDKMKKITFDLAVETYQPVFDHTTELPTDCSMIGIGYDVYNVDSSFDASLLLVSPKNYSEENVIYPCGYPLMISWTYRSQNSDMNTLALGYEDSSGTYFHINEMIPNQMNYIWDIPTNMNTYVSTEISIMKDSSIVEVHKQPEVTILPNYNTKKIDKNSFLIKDAGFFLSKLPESSINFTIDYTDSSGNVKMATNYYFNIKKQR